MHTRFCLCAGSPSLESLFPTDLWKPCNQILLGFKISVSGNSQTLSWVRRLGSLTWGPEPSQTVGELHWHYCSPVLWVTHLRDVGFACIVIVSLLLSHCSFFPVLGRGVSFLGGFQCPLGDGCSTTSCDLGGLSGEEELLLLLRHLEQMPPWLEN